MILQPSTSTSEDETPETDGSITVDYFLPQRVFRLMQETIHQGLFILCSDIVDDAIDVDFLTESDVTRLVKDATPNLKIVPQLLSYPTCRSFNHRYKGCSHLCFLNFNNPMLEVVEMFTWPEMKAQPYVAYF